MSGEEVLELIRQKSENEEKIKELSEDNRRLREAISSGYFDYLKKKFSEMDEWYVCVNTWVRSYEFYHLGKFKYFSFLGKKNAKRLPHYSNDYHAHFEFLDGFTTDLNTIARNGLSIDIAKDDLHVEIDSDVQDGNIRFENGVAWITKDFFEKEKKRTSAEISKYSGGSYGEFKCGDRIEYANRNGIFSGTIMMIRGKSAFLKDGTKVNISTPRVKKI